MNTPHSMIPAPPKRNKGKGVPPQAEESGVSPLRAKGKGAPPPLTRPSVNLGKAASGQPVPVNFKMSAEFVREFKMFAAEHDLKLNELFEKAFYHYKENTK
jgi:hypothetical protein